MIDRLMGALPSASSWPGGFAWTLAWQSTLWLAIGLLAARIWQHRAGRAHLLLVLATSAAVVSPMLTATVRRMEWGVLSPPPAIANDPPASNIVPATPLAAQEPLRGASIDEAVDWPRDDPPELLARGAQQAVPEDPVAPLAQPKTADENRKSASPALSTRVIGFLPMAIGGVWTIAALALAVRLIVSILAGRRITQEAHEETNPQLMAALHEAARALSLVPVPHLRGSAFARSPMIWCWGPRPVVLVPESASQQPRILWHSVFCHELAHVIRRDHWWALLAEIVVILLPWQPLVWLCRRRLAFLREQACDDWVLAAGGAATDYADSLLQFAPQGSSSHALAAVSSAELLKRRLEHVLAGVHIVPKVGTFWMAVASVTSFFAIVVVAFAQQGPGTVSSQASRPRAMTRPLSQHTEKDAPPQVGTERTLQLAGHVFDEGGSSIVGAHVSATATRRVTDRGGTLEDHHEVLGEATTDGTGSFHLDISRVSAKTHNAPVLIAASDGYAIASQPFNLDGTDKGLVFRLSKERIVRGRFVDLQGQPAAHVSAHVAQIGLDPMTFLPPDGADLGRNPRLPAAWPKKFTSDAQGRFAIHGVAAHQTVYLSVDGDDRYAQQFLPVKRRGDATQSGPPSTTSDEVVVPLSPATVVEGVVRFADTKLPAPNARITVYASQEKPPFGSFVGIAAQADAQGRFRVVPYPGVYFQVTAYPPQGAPYLIRQTASGAKAGATRAEINVDLPRGILVRGRIREAQADLPIAKASIQYIPASKTQARAGGSVVTGWPGIALSDSKGEFAIAVLPGLGHLLIHGPTADYACQEIGDQQLSQGRPGGRRNYAHAISRVDPPDNSTSPIDVAVKLTRVPLVTGRLLGPDGRPVEEALMISRLQINPLSPTWRGERAEVVRDGHFALSGCAPGISYPTYFLDQNHQLGATYSIGASRASREPVIVQLTACGAAKARFVDSEGKPIAELEPSLHLVVTPGAFPYNGAAARRGQLAADQDFAANVDRKNQTPSPKSGSDGIATFRVLIPGATYELHGGRNRELASLKQFTAEAGKTLDLGDIVADRPRGR